MKEWTCAKCGQLQTKIWCFDCDIHSSGKTLAQLREEDAIWRLDLALRAGDNIDKVAKA